MFARIPLMMLLFLLTATGPGHAIDCNAAAQAEAAKYGGEAIWAGPVQKDGATYCEIKIRVPGKGGQPPRVIPVRVPG